MDGEKDMISLTKGSRYRVESVQSRDSPLVSRGTFKGYTVVGPEQGICIELDSTHGEQEGTIRIIPCHMIIAIDVLEAVEFKEKSEEPERMYG